MSGVFADKFSIVPKIKVMLGFLVLAIEISYARKSS